MVMEDRPPLDAVRLLPTNPVLDLVNAAWAMCVEQQNGGAPGWSMAKSWAWDRLNEAVEPFLRRDEDGDIIELSSTPIGPSGTGWPDPPLSTDSAPNPPVTTDT